jgi:molybdate transport system substrate-binding protein
MRRALVFGALLLVACSSQDEQPLVVFAASSLADAFAELERDFEAEHPDVDVAISTAGSQALRVQIEQGAAADVFASANVEHIEALHAANLVEAPVAFAAGALVVAVPDDNPAGIETFADLPHARRIVLGGETVPVGAYTQKLLERTGEDFAGRVLARVVSREPNVRLVVAKVELGEADAAIVYRSDVRAQSRAKAIAIPHALQPAIDYLVAPVGRSAQPQLAQAFLDHLASERGRATLTRHGFHR